MKKSVQYMPKALLVMRPLVLAMGLAVGGGMLVACGGGGGGSTVSSAPTVSGGNMTVQSGTSATHRLNASHPAGAALSYSIKTQPRLGSARVDANGVVTYFAHNVIGDDSLVVSVSAGQASADATLNVKVQALAAFDRQFYRVTNPQTLNAQIVSYDPNDKNPATNQKVIKDNVRLSSNVFVMSAAKEGDKTKYLRRDYAVFLDPNTASEKRTGRDSRGGTFEYTFYSDNVLKRFDAADPSKEAVIFSSARLPADARAGGLVAMDSQYDLLLNPTDIDNSYVQTSAYQRLADVLRNEIAHSIPHAPITVRVADGSSRMGRAVSLVVNEVTGRTDKLLFNYLAVHTRGNYPADPALARRLQLCEANLSACVDVAGGAGNYFKLGENSTHIYMAMQGSSKLFAFNKSNSQLAEVTGVAYPAAFDQHRHLIGSSDSHGGDGVLTNFSSIVNKVTALAEGATSYVAINYDLDLDTPVNKMYGMDNFMHKHAMILKFNGTQGVKVYDNGDGIDHGDASDTHDKTISDHISLAAVKNGKLFFEGASYSGLPQFGGTCTPVPPNNTGCSTHRQGWLDTTTGSFPKKTMDNVLGNRTYAFLIANRVPPVAVGEHIYFSEASGTGVADRIYSIYKMSLNDTSSPRPATPNTMGRMFFERTAFRSSGIFDGSVLLWNRVSKEIVDATTNVVIGSQSTIETEPNTINNTIAASGGTNLVGVGGLFGLKMATSHGGIPFLVSGASGQAGSLTRVNRIQGDWIID